MKLFFPLLATFCLSSCATIQKGHYQFEVPLSKAAEKVLVLDKKHVTECRDMPSVTGEAKGREIESSVTNAMNDARNKAATKNINVLVYSETILATGFNRYYLDLELKGYQCSDENLKKHFGSPGQANAQAQASASSQKQIEEANQQAALVNIQMLANQQAAMAAQQAAMAAQQAAMMAAQQAAMMAAQQAAMAASQSAMMHHHHGM